MVLVRIDCSAYSRVRRFNLTPGPPPSSPMKITPPSTSARSMLLEVRSVADFGCAQGVWLRAWKANGASEVVGLDGDFVDRSRLLIEAGEFVVADLTNAIDLGRRFDLVQSLEVAEHLPPDSAQTLVDNLVRHAIHLLFSAAPPGQVGEYHVNERPHAFWRDLLAARGYALLDCVRPRIANETAIMPWYRYNTFLFVHRDALARLPAVLIDTRIPEGAPVPDISPGSYKLRKLFVRALPYGVRQHLAARKGRSGANRLRSRDTAAHGTRAQTDRE